jgi:hypothetical protein
MQNIEGLIPTPQLQRSPRIKRRVKPRVCEAIKHIVERLRARNLQIPAQIFVYGCIYRQRGAHVHEVAACDADHIFHVYDDLVLSAFLRSSM